MPDVQEVFRMATQKVRRDPGAMDRQVERSSGRQLGTAAWARSRWWWCSSRSPSRPSRSRAAKRRTCRRTRHRSRSDQGGAGNDDRSSTRVTSRNYRRASQRRGRLLRRVSPTTRRSPTTRAALAPDPLFVANVDGTQVRQISRAGRDAYGAQWSPDGSMLVYQQRNGSTQHLGNLFVQDVGTGQRTQVTDFDQTQQWGWWFTFPSFAPDGRSILFQLPRGDPEQPDLGPLVRAGRRRGADPRPAQRRVGRLLAGRQVGSRISHRSTRTTSPAEGSGSRASTGERLEP